MSAESSLLSPLHVHCVSLFRMAAWVHVEGQNLELLKKMITFLTSKSREKSPCTKTFSSCGLNGSNKTSALVSLEHLVSIFRSRFSTSHHPCTKVLLKSILTTFEEKLKTVVLVFKQEIVSLLIIYTLYILRLNR